MKQREESWKYDVQRSIFGEIRGVWIADEALAVSSYLMYLLNQTKHEELWRSKIVKIYAH